MTEKQRTITVSGRGSVSSPPDLGHLRLGARVTDDDPEVALKRSNEQVSRVQSVLLDAGVAEDDVRLGHLTINPVYDHNGRRRELRGYEVRHDLTVTVREIARTGALLSIAVHAGANHVGGVSFSVEDPGSLLDRARERGFENARHKAHDLARLAGKQLGEVVSIDETSHEPVLVERHHTRALAAMAEPPSDVPIDPDDTEFTIHLAVVWDIE